MKRYRLKKNLSGLKTRIRFENTLNRLESDFFSILPFIIIVKGFITYRLYVGWFCFAIVIEFKKL